MRTEREYMRQALRLARRGYGATSPNPMVGAILVKNGQLIGRGWHRRAGEPHAEIEVIRDAEQRGQTAKGATLYVTLEPCCTQGRTPPCTEAIIAAGIKKVIVGATDPNPRHSGRAFAILKRASIAVKHGVLEEACKQLNESFNHWIVHHTPFVTIKAAMSLDGKIATASGESKWITSEPARAYGMKLRQRADAILVGINTILADDPSLTARGHKRSRRHGKQLRRIVLDPMGRTPLHAKVVTDEQHVLTTIVVSELAPKSRVAALEKRVRVLVAPFVEFRKRDVQRLRGAPARPLLDLGWVLRTLGSESITSLLIEGGGEVNASFLSQGFAHRIAFFYAPKILGGRDSVPAVAGEGASSLEEALRLTDVQWRRLGPDLLLSARIPNSEFKL